MTKPKRGELWSNEIADHNANHGKPPVRVRWRMLPDGFWVTEGLEPFDLTIERVRKSCYDYGSGDARRVRWGSSTTLAHAKWASVQKLLMRLSVLHSKARSLDELKPASGHVKSRSK